MLLAYDQEVEALPSMRTVPTHSQFGFREGMWFVFKDESHALALWLSALTGKEELYVDGELRSSSRAINLSSTHAVEVGSYKYTISLVTRNLRKGKLECTLRRDGAFVHGFSTQWIRKKSTWARMAIAAIAVAVTLSIFQAGHIPWYIFAPLLFLVVAVGALPTRGEGFVFHEIPPPKGSDA
ncbi:MAG: hypothetical protein ACK46L_15480 [Synechococcaceae cyanobacterium]